MIHRSCVKRDRRSGFSLLEVILALAILTGALALIAEMTRLGARNAQLARDLTRAQLHCESKLAEITAGISSPDPVSGASFPDPLDAEWAYSVMLEPAAEEGMVAVRVTVYQNVAPQLQPAEFSLVRWIIDPGIELPQATETEQSSIGAESSSSTDSGSSDSSSGS